MGLVRFGDGIEDITGPFGGVYFGHDSQGAHIRARPRTTQRTATAAQRLQRNWYSSKKYAERFGFPEEAPPIDEIPPGTHCVYSCETLYAHRQPSLQAPVLTPVETTGYWPQQIINWVNNYWQPGFLEWGLTKTLMQIMMFKWFYIHRWTWGFSGASSFIGAKVNMVNWISASSAAVAVPILTLWVGLLALGAVFAFMEWLEGINGYIEFNPGRIVIRKGSTLWWGGLVGRPHYKMYDFAICSLSAFEGIIHKQITGTGQYHLNRFHFDDLWQTSSHKLLFWYVYTYSNLLARFRGNGFKIGPNLIRMVVSESQHAYWNVPVGWSRAPEGACFYLTQFDDHFGWGGHPQPPL